MKIPCHFPSACAGLIARALGLAVLPGCKDKADVSDSVSKLEGAFAKPPADAPPAEQQQIKDAVDAALKAAKNNDPEAAGVSLQVLRATPNLSAEQRIAVQDAMGDLQSKLAARAEQGDQQAIKAMNALRGTARR